MSTARISQLQGQNQAYLARKSALLAKLEDAEQLIARDERVKDALNTLGQRCAQEATGIYSELLSAIVEDVMGLTGPKIELVPGIKASRPTLDIIGIHENEAEDILESQGGSIANLLAAGLRFIGLALSNHRRFAILDEPDCWLEGRLATRFMAVLDNLCSKLGVQAVVISHHRDALQTVDVARVELSPCKEHGIQAVFTPKQVQEEKDESSEFNSELTESAGIQSVRLINLMSHHDTTIPLGKGLTAIIGPNHLGKSVITRAFGDVIANRRLHSRIRRGQEFASVELALEDGLRLKWTLTRTDKSLPRAGYALFDKEDSVIELDDDATEAPQWLHGYLAMPPISDSGLNLHIGEQKDPLFVLNPQLSTHKRAELIKLSNKSQLVNDMLTKHRENIKEARRTSRECQHELNELNNHIERLRIVCDLQAGATQNTSIEAKLRQCNEQLQAIATFGAMKTQERKKAFTVLQDSFTLMGRQSGNEEKSLRLQRYLTKQTVQDNRERVIQAAKFSELQAITRELELRNRQQQRLLQVANQERAVRVKAKGLKVLSAIPTAGQLEERHAQLRRIKGFAKRSTHEVSQRIVMAQLGQIHQALTHEIHQAAGRQCPVCEQALGL